MSRKYRNTETFIQEANEIHGGKYSYQKSVFTKVMEKVTITCPIHGDFEQVAITHLGGHGCRDCANQVRNRYTKESFIEKARSVHGDRYDYSNVVITGKRAEKVEIVCHEHGKFKQDVYSHNRGYNCPKCARELVGRKAFKGMDWFLKEAEKVHGSRYDYSKSVYKGSEKPITIRCKRHGEWSILPRTHLSGCNCPKCALEDKDIPHQKNTEQFLLEARAKHGNKFDYSNTEYVNNVTKVSITCPDHGEFMQVPSVHLFGHGCPECSAMHRTGSYSISSLRDYHRENMGILYHIRIEAPDGRVFDKVGITERTVEERFSRFSKYGYKLLGIVRVCEGTLEEMVYLETIIMESLKESDRAYRVHDFKHIPAIGGWTECFLPITYEGELK